MTDEPEFDFKKNFRQVITTQLAQIAANGGSWQEALAYLKETLEIDPADLEREIATILELKAMDQDINGGGKNDLIDLSKERAQRSERQAKDSDGNKERTKNRQSSQAGSGRYGAGVRAQVFEVVVRQGMQGAPWRSICAGPMAVNNISADEVQAEIDRRRGKMGGQHAKKDDEKPPRKGTGGSSKAPKKPFPFFGGAKKAPPGKSTNNDDDDNDE